MWRRASAAGFVARGRKRETQPNPSGFPADYQFEPLRYEPSTTRSKEDGLSLTSHTAAGCALAALVAASPTYAQAQSREQAANYVVTTFGASDAGNAVVREGLSIVRTGKSVRLQLAGADGSVLSVPAQTTAQGMLAVQTQDGAVTCYNMAVDALNALRQPARNSASVSVRFGGSVVPISLRVSASQTRGRIHSTVLRGASAGLFSAGADAVNAGVLVDAAVQDDGGILSAAAFDEVHYLRAPSNVVARSTCVIQRVVPQRQSRV